MPEPAELYRNFGVLSIAIIVAGLGYLIYKWPGNKSMSFSQHAAVSRRSRVYYAVLFTVSLPLLYLFAVKWLVPTLQLSVLFEVLFVAAITGQLVAVYVPETGGFKTMIHNIGAYTMHLLLIPLALIIFLSSVATLPVKTIAILAAILMTMIFLVLLFFKSARKYNLYFQILYVACFLVAILSAVYF